MASTELYVYTDAVSHLLDLYGTGSPDAVTLRKIKRAVENSYRQIAHMRDWNYFFQRANLITVASQTTGTIAFDYTGGTYERVVTLTGATWPSYAQFAVLRIGNVDYEVEAYKSSTEITLSVNNNPGEDVAAGTSYTMFRDTYPCPLDVSRVGPMRDANNALWPEFVAPNELIARRVVGQYPTFPRMYTICGDQNYIGSLAFKFYPPPDQAFHYDYSYYRRPRQFSCYQYTTGTVSSTGTAVTGVGTAFTQSMIGCIIRFSSSTTLPTGTTGSNPYVEQRSILGWTSATSITLDQALSSNASSVAFEISDPIDIESGSLYTAFLRKCELEMAMMLNRGDTARFQTQYDRAEREALEADSRLSTIKPSEKGAYARVPLTWVITNSTN